MRVILIDDEFLALEYLERLLTKIGGTRIIGKYINPHEALEAVLQLEPDVVFLDVEMPEINGIELAQKIQVSLPDIHIVFVTAYNEYAVKAFELNAIDYLVKPIQHTRLNETLHRLPKVIKKDTSPTSSERDNMVCTFNSLSFISAGKPLDVRWRTTRARGIFLFLLQHRETYVSKDTLLDLFWPDADFEKGLAQLYGAVYQIRKTLSSTPLNIVVTNHENGYRLDLNDVKLTSVEWEKGIMDHPIVTAETLPTHQSLLELYSGDYLAKEDYFWAENERERLRVLWLQHISNVASFLEDDAQYTQSISLYLRVQLAQPHVDRSYFKLMKLYNKLGDVHAVEQQYKQLKKMLQEEFGFEEPAVDILSWYRSWLQTVSHE